MNRTVTLLSIVLTLATNVVQAWAWQALPGKAPELADNTTRPEKIELAPARYILPLFG